MLREFIDRSNGGYYFIAAKFYDRSCQGTPRFSWRCRYLDRNGLESFCFKRSRESCALVLLSDLRQRWAKRIEIVTSRQEEV